MNEKDGSIRYVAQSQVRMKKVLMSADSSFRKAAEAREGAWLAPYAVKSVEHRGREYPEPEHNYRTAFQRDRDRVIHSTAFRRLQYKTQVFVNYEGDHYRTRLTHTLETTQIARTIGRVLRLNEDLIEAIALAHDLGHGPFGHAGESALACLMKDQGGFEHNQQGLRIVEVLEESYQDFSGLNLTADVRESFKKHGERAFDSLESVVVDLSDSIAYESHDLDDGLRAGYFDKSDLQGVSLWREAASYVRQEGNKGGEVALRRAMIRLLITKQVGDLLSKTLENIRKLKGTKPSALKHRAPEIVCFSGGMVKQKGELREILQKKLYNHFRVIRMTNKGQRFIEELFRVYGNEPKLLPPNILKKIERDSLERVVCDYIAGMTDRFALDEYKRLFEPYERV